MKKLPLIKIVMLLAIAVLTIGTPYAQKSKKGARPSWMTWSRGKDFKHLGPKRASKIKFCEKESVYLFVVDVTEKEYIEDEEENGFTLDDVEAMASLEASVEFARRLKTSIDEEVSSGVKNSGKRERVFSRTTNMVTDAKFSGFNKVGSYWERKKNQNTGKTEITVSHLYSMCSSTFKDTIERVAGKLEIEDLSESLTARIETAAEDVDDLGDW